jgi:DNA repair protein RecO (recombination protein O)
VKERVMGMVLSAATIGEYDKRVVLLTKERGKISAFARGARRPKSPLSASTEPFTFGEFYVYRGRDSYTVEQVEVKNYFPEIRKDLNHLYMALYFCELAGYFTREGIEATEELNLLYLSLRALFVPSIPENLVRYIYEFRMLAIEGEAPRIFSCIKCGKAEKLHHFYVQEAGIVCDCCCGGKTGITISETAVYTLQRILSSPLATLYTFTVSEPVLLELQRVVSRYLDAHTDKKFKTLSVLDLC